MKIYQNSTKLGKNVGIFIAYIPCLKALMCGINAVGAQGSGCMFTLCHAPLKMAVLLHKMASVCKQALMTVGRSTLFLKTSVLGIYFRNLNP